MLPRSNDAMLRTWEAATRKDSSPVLRTLLDSIWTGKRDSVMARERGMGGQEARIYMERARINAISR
jgi:hypothetical protein